jgi:signal transduction histidine kinase
MFDVMSSSLRGRLIAVWLLLLGAAAAIAIVFVAIYRQTTDAQEDRASDLLLRACTEIGERYAAFMASDGDAAMLRMASGTSIPDALRDRMTGIIEVSLSQSQGLEGGFWSTDLDSLAYAYPTYAGTGPKTDVPLAELGSIREVNGSALASGEPVIVRRPSQAQILLLAACPMRGALPAVTAWTMTRLHTAQGAAYRNLLLGLCLLAAVVVLSAVLLGRVIWMWSRRIDGLQAALAGAEASGGLPTLPETGEKELDRFVAALNDARTRLGEARERASAAERYAVAGRLAAGIAHEIRNPIAAMRLKAENAVAAGETERKDDALLAILDQIRRLDRLLRDLLTMTQRSEPQRTEVDIGGLVGRCVEAVQDRAAAAGLTLESRIAPELGAAARLRIDGDQIVRALENLLVNAVQHTPSGGRVWLETSARRDGPVFRVGNSGGAISPAIAERLFEPFVTGRRDGTGLGLAIVREIATAHGGRVRLEAGDGPVIFALELPWTERPS